MTTKQQVALILGIVLFFFAVLTIGILYQLSVPDDAFICLNNDLEICKR
jgi:hypothetical protein